MVQVTARMLSFYLLCAEGDGGLGKRRLLRVHIERRRFIYQEEIIVFSLLRLFCSV